MTTSERIAEIDEKCSQWKKDRENEVVLLEEVMDLLDSVAIAKERGELLRRVDAWRGLDGDGITDPLRQEIKEAIE